MQVLLLGWLVDRAIAVKLLHYVFTLHDNNVKFITIIMHHNTFHAGNVPVGMSNVQCIGIENGLSNCRHDDGGSGTSCDSSHYASAICTDVSSGIRLVGGSNPYEGRVELRVMGGEEWGTVCDDGWDENDALVACQQMGFAGVSRIGQRGEFFTGGGPIVLRLVNMAQLEKAPVIL